MRLVFGGTVQTENKADTVTNWPLADTIATYAGWATLPTAAQVNNSGFGVALSANVGTLTTEVTASVDHIRITVCYAPTNEQPPPELRIGRLLPDRAPGRQRAAASAYWLDNVPAIAEPAQVLQPEGAIYVADPQRQYRRAAASAYWFDNRLAVAPPEDTTAAISMPDVARGPRRAANTAYWRHNPPIPPPDEAFTPPLPKMPDRVYAPRRASAGAYWFDNRLAVPPPEAPTEGQVELPQRVWSDRWIGFSRTANTAYWLHNQAAVPPPEAPTDGRPAMSEPARPYRRAAASAYWWHNQQPPAEGPGSQTTACDYLRVEGDECVTQAVPAAECEFTKTTAAEVTFTKAPPNC